MVAQVRPDNPPAFPRQWPAYEELHGDAGMTLRDYFAGQALPFTAAQDYGNDWGKGGVDHAPRAAKHAYAIADAMLAARAKEVL